MRREGYEFQVSRPEVIFHKAADGETLLEPYEEVHIETSSETVGVVVEMLGARRGQMMDMRDTGQGTRRLVYIVPTRGLLGFRYQFLTSTRGMGIMNTVFHGYTSNSDPPANETLHNGGNPNVDYIASVFDVVHDAGGSTALYASKSKFVLFDRSYDASHGAVDAVPPDHGRDKIDRYLYVPSGATASGLHATFLSEMGANHYNYCFVHYLDLDSVGHSAGWGSATWNAALRTLDAYLGEIFDLVTSDPLLAGHTTILVSADHGGTGTNHGQANLVEDYTIPLLAWGAGVAQGVDLYGLNGATRSDPGTARPDYNAAPQPIRNGGTGNLALQLLGLPAIPGSTVNAAQDLKVNGTTPVRAGTWSDVKQEYQRP